MGNEKVILTDIVWFQEGPGVRNTQYTDSGVKLLNVANLVDGKVDLSTSNRYISKEEAYGKYKHFLVDPGDFIIASSGIKVDYFDKKMGFVDETQLPLCMNTSTIRFKTLDSNVLNIRYFMYYLKSFAFKEQLARQITGSAQLNFGPSHLKKMSMPLCSIKKQGEICEQLDIVYHMIEMRQQQLIELDSLIKARFVEMFDLQNYERKTLAECTDFVDYRGHTPALSDNGNIRMINAKSVGKGFFKYVDEFITEETYNSWMHRGFGSPGDILFVTEGHTFGNTCLIPNDMKKFALGQRVITIKGHDEIENIFLCSYMQTDMFWKDINVYRTGGTAQGIRSKDLAQILVPMPPRNEQDEFAIFVNQVDKSKVAVQKALEKEQLLFDSLMQKYFG